MSPSPRLPRAIGRCLGVVAFLTVFSGLARGEDGAAIYKAKCAACHGDHGQGSPDAPRALAGDKTPAQLSKLIARTMPEDDPGTCVGEDAERVAAYIHDSFYSAAAQARNKPARVELSRLTVRQYRNVVADLVGSFRDQPWHDPERGLHAQYFKSRRYQDKDRVIDRVDPEVRFDFGVGSPDPEKFDANQFSIRWDGAALAPETGDYEFVVRTENAIKLWVNDLRKPLIDATVKSGSDNEYRASIPLLGGRAYSIRLEFSKAKQGVDDSKDKKKKPPLVRSNVELAWKPPGRAEEVIPRHALAPHPQPEGFVLSTPFPADDRSMGYERATTISKAWDAATTDAALEVAGYVGLRLRDLSGVKDDDGDREAKLKEFARKFVERAFRRPLSDDQKAFFVDRQFREAPDKELAIKRVVLLALKSPRFLYREVGSPSPDGYDVASRLSFGMYDSSPDQPLLDAAAQGKLGDPEEVVRQAQRLQWDPRARSKVREFFFRWLRVEQPPDVSKDAEHYPGFGDAIASDLRSSLDLFLEDVLWGPRPDFRDLFTSESLYLNGQLAAFYGVELPPDAPFQKVFPEPERAGVVTHPYLMATFAYTGTTSPIHRGVFLARSVLGRTLRPPPEAVAPLAPDLHASLSTRERVALQTSPAACMTCHGMVNPLGFGLENFDAVGRYRREEGGRPIDASGGYQARSGEAVTFSGAKALATWLASSEEAQSAFVDQFFHFLVKQPIRAFGPDESAKLRKSFAQSGDNVRELMVRIVADAAIRSGRANSEQASGK